MMPINSYHKPNWRPQKELNRAVHVNNIEVSKPITAEDAMRYVANLCLPEIVCYDGYPDIQNELIVETAVKNFPEIFKDETAPQNQQLDYSCMYPVVSSFYKQHTRNDGSIDWESASNNTKYVVQCERIAEQTETPKLLSIQLSDLSAIDLSVKVG